MSQCKEMVWHHIGYQFTTQCSRKATRDGYCGHHHPDAEARREKRAREKFRKEQIEVAGRKEDAIREWCKAEGYRLEREGE